MKKNLSLALAGLAGAALLAAGCASEQTPSPAPMAANNPPAEPVAASAAAPVAPVTPPVQSVALAPVPLTYQWFKDTNISAAKIVFKVVKVDSEETAGENGNGANAVDGDPNTLWHTQWQDAAPECPHEIVIELATASTLKGCTYLPRQDDSENGMIKGYEFYVSNDGQDFGQPVAKGEFDNSKTLKTVSFSPQAGRFIKLKALSEINGEAWTSAAEIGVVIQ